MSTGVLLYAPDKAPEMQSPLAALCQAIAALSEPPELARTTEPADSFDYLLCADLPSSVRLLVLALPDIREPIRDAFRREDALFRWIEEKRATGSRRCTALERPPSIGHAHALAGLGAWWQHLRHEVDRWLLLAQQEAQMRDLACEAMRHGFAQYDADGNVVGIASLPDGPEAAA